jgi:hypothetical protein
MALRVLIAVFLVLGEFPNVILRLPGALADGDADDFTEGQASPRAATFAACAIAATLIFFAAINQLYVEGLRSPIFHLLVAMIGYTHTRSHSFVESRSPSLLPLSAMAKATRHAW